MKIGKFITAIVCIALAITLEIFLYKYLDDTMPLEGLSKVGNILLIPLTVIVYLLLYSILFGACGNSIGALYSSSKVIMIISIFLLCVSIALISCSAVLTVRTVQSF